jgi:hypothetical protein
LLVAAAAAAAAAATAAAAAAAVVVVTRAGEIRTQVSRGATTEGCEPHVSCHGI